MSDPAGLHNSLVSEASPELRESTVLDDATEAGQEVRCITESLGVQIATDPMAWEPHTTALGEFWPKQGERAVLAFSDGPPVIVWWDPEEREPDAPLVTEADLAAEKASREAVDKAEAETRAAADAALTAAIAAMGEDDYKGSVRACTTAKITISTALNSGDTIDGVVLANADRVLVAHQTPKSQNGLYVVGASPARAADADGAGELSGGTMVYVEQGTKYGGRVMRIVTAGSITPGTTSHEWAPLTPRDYGLVEAPPTSAALVGDTCKIKGGTGVYWDFLYTGENPELPWNKIGGPPLAARSDIERSLTNKTTYESLPTDPLKITVPLKGDYDIRVEATIQSPATASAFGAISYATGATAASDNWCGIGWSATAATTFSDGGKTTPHSGVAASAEIIEKARTAGNYTVSWARRRLFVDPVAVG